MIIRDISSDPLDPRWVQLGVLHGSIGSCDFPGIYTRLEDAAVLDFIERETSRNNNTLLTRDNDVNLNDFNVEESDLLLMSTAESGLCKRPRNRLNEFPFITIVGFEKSRENQEAPSFILTCTGVLINRRYVLTVASCFDVDSGFGLPEGVQRQVRLGDYSTDGDPDCSGDICAPKSQTIPVEEVIIHDSYSKALEDIQYNMALVKMEKSATFNDGVFPVCLPNFNENEPRLNASDEIYVVGYPGVAAASNEGKNSTLTGSKASLISPNECNSRWRNWREDFQAQFGTQICAEENVNTCLATIGSALMRINGVEDKMVLLGLHSIGLPCEGEETPFPDIFVRIDAFVNWIMQTIGYKID